MTNQLAYHSEPLRATIHDIKYFNELNGGYFFSRNTMKTFGDTMCSFGVRTFEGKRVFYRKPGIMMAGFDKPVMATRDNFHAWVFNGATIENLPKEETMRLYDSL